MTARGTYSYSYPRPMVTVDAVVFVRVAGGREVLLIRRANEPFQGAWALPGGYLEMDETLETGVARELREETGLCGVALRQFHTFSALDRDPRGRTISTAYVGTVPEKPDSLAAASDAADLAWHPVDHLPEMAFDHRAIVCMAREHEDERESR